MNHLPRLLITMGDVAGIGPEIIARGWKELVQTCRPVVVGDPHWMRSALSLIQSEADVVVVDTPEGASPDPRIIPCLAATKQDLQGIHPGQLSAAAGRAAYDFLCT